MIVRPRDLFDNAVPCGNSGAVMALLRLGLHTGDSKYQEIAISALKSVADLMQRVPNGFAWWLCALDFHLARVQEVVVMGAPDDPDTARLVDTARSGFAPNRIYAGADGPSDEERLPLLAGKDLIGGKATAYPLRELRLPRPNDRSGGVRPPTGLTKSASSLSGCGHPVVTRTRPQPGLEGV